MRKKHLDHRTIKKLNEELLLCIQELGTNIFTGEFLTVLFELCHHIDNHGYEENKFYKAYINKNNTVLLDEIHVPTHKTSTLQTT